MKDIAFYDSVTSQLDAISMDSSPHTSADGHVLCNDVALNLCAIGDQNARGVKLALDASGNFHSALAGNFADDRDLGADRGNLAGRFWSLRGRDWRLYLLDKRRDSIVVGRVVLRLSEHVVLLI